MKVSNVILAIPALCLLVGAFIGMLIGPTGMNSMDVYIPPPGWTSQPPSVETFSQEEMMQLMKDANPVWKAFRTNEFDTLQQMMVQPDQAECEIDQRIADGDYVADSSVIILMGTADPNELEPSHLAYGDIVIVELDGKFHWPGESFQSVTGIVEFVEINSEKRIVEFSFTTADSQVLYSCTTPS